MDGHFSNPPSEREDRIRWAENVAGEIMSRYGRVPLPGDVRPTHLWEVEFQSAMCDPDEAERANEAERDRMH